MKKIAHEQILAALFWLVLGFYLGLRFMGAFHDCGVLEAKP